MSKNSKAKPKKPKDRRRVRKKLQNKNIENIKL
jgi:hypothetical protein